MKKSLLFIIISFVSYFSFAVVLSIYNDFHKNIEPEVSTKRHNPESDKKVPEYIEGKDKEQIQINGQINKIELIINKKIYTEISVQENQKTPQTVIFGLKQTAIQENGNHSIRIIIDSSTTTGNDIVINTAHISTLSAEGKNVAYIRYSGKADDTEFFLNGNLTLKIENSELKSTYLHIKNDPKIVVDDCQIESLFIYSSLLSYDLTIQRSNISHINRFDEMK